MFSGTAHWFSSRSKKAARSKANKSILAAASVEGSQDTKENQSNKKSKPENSVKKEASSTSSKKKKTKKKMKRNKTKFYAVRKGRQTGIFDHWDDCKPQVNGFKQAEFKSFATKDEAELYLKGNPSVAEKTKKRKLSTIIESSDEQSPKKKTNSKSKVVVYTDGACSGNGQDSASAGIGVYFGDDDPRNISEALPEFDKFSASNQRAELYAIVRALEETQNLGEDTCLEIRTDSIYSIKSVTEWVPKFTELGKNSEELFKKYKNIDLMQRIIALKSERDVSFQHVKGHAGNHGNEQADHLARAGCKKTHPT